MKRKFLISFVACLFSCLLAIMNIGCFDLLDDYSGDLSGGSSSKFEFVGETQRTYEYISSLGYTCEITGTIKNISSRSYSYVEIDFIVYDEAGNNLGTVLYNVNNINPGDT